MCVLGPNGENDFCDARNLIRAFKHLIPIFNETCLFASWNDVLEYCEDKIYYILTDEGICFTFNSPGLKDIFREEA